MLTNATDYITVAMYSCIRRKNRLHGSELTLIPFLFFVLGVCVETATVFYFKTKVSATVVTNSTRAKKP